MSERCAVIADWRHVLRRSFLYLSGITCPLSTLEPLSYWLIQNCPTTRATSHMPLFPPSGLPRFQPLSSPTVVPTSRRRASQYHTTCFKRVSYSQGFSGTGSCNERCVRLEKTMFTTTSATSGAPKPYCNKGTVHVVM